MTIADCIDTCIRSIHDLFYVRRPEREFYRDVIALQKAIARYGYVCTQRGWDFDPDFITHEIVDLLRRVSPPDKVYLPVYLQGCIDRHVRQRAEELAEMAESGKAAKTFKLAIKRVRQAVVPDTLVPRSGTEVLAELYRDLGRRTRKPRKEGKQLNLL